MFLENVHINNKNMLYYDRIDELILIKQVHQKSMIFITIGIF